LRHELAVRLFVTRCIIPDLGRPVKHFCNSKINCISARRFLGRTRRGAVPFLYCDPCIMEVKQRCALKAQVRCRCGIFYGTSAVRRLK